MLGGRGRAKTGRTGRLRRERHHDKHDWWKVMCLTGVDYFSTLGYQPAIAFLAAGLLSPLATLILVLLTPVEHFRSTAYVAHKSPRGEGSIRHARDAAGAMEGQALFVLCLIGFAATDFIITITLSSADATATSSKTSFVPKFFHHRVALTLFLLLVLGAIFLKGFKEAIGIAVTLVSLPSAERRRHRSQHLRTGAPSCSLDPLGRRPADDALGARGPDTHAGALPAHISEARVGPVGL